MYVKCLQHRTMCWWVQYRCSILGCVISALRGVLVLLPKGVLQRGTIFYLRNLPRCISRISQMGRGRNPKRGAPTYYSAIFFSKKYMKTRMHSSRIRTIRCSDHLGWGDGECLPGGVAPLPPYKPSMCTKMDAHQCFVSRSVSVTASALIFLMVMS